MPDLRRQPFARRLLAMSAVSAMSAALAQGAPTAGRPQLDLPRATLTAGMHRMDVQLATTNEQRMTGLMHRRHMPDGEGMLFVFESAQPQCFWMRNTLIALTAAFVADDGTIVNLADMQPLDESSHCSAQPVRYVLEMNQGWFVQRHIGAGHRLRGPMFAAASAAQDQGGTARAGAAAKPATAKPASAKPTTAKPAAPGQANP